MPSSWAWAWAASSSRAAARFSSRHYPPLDTLLLAMPVPWKGTLQQYAGRLHRLQSGKTSVRIIDWLDLGHPVPQRMWERRLRGYRAMGYSLIADP